MSTPAFTVLDKADLRWTACVSMKESHWEAFGPGVWGITSSKCLSQLNVALLWFGEQGSELWLEKCWSLLLRNAVSTLTALSVYLDMSSSSSSALGAHILSGDCSHPLAMQMGGTLQCSPGSWVKSNANYEILQMTEAAQKYSLCHLFFSCFLSHLLVLIFNWVFCFSLFLPLLTRHFALFIFNLYGGFETSLFSP